MWARSDGPDIGTRVMQHKGLWVVKEVVICMFGRNVVEFDGVGQQMLELGVLQHRELGGDAALMRVWPVHNHLIRSIKS